MTGWPFWRDASLLLLVVVLIAALVEVLAQWFAYPPVKGRSELDDTIDSRLAHKADLFYVEHHLSRPRKGRR